MGVEMEKCQMKKKRRKNFEIGEEEMEIGMGINGERGVIREKLLKEEEIVDKIMERILREMNEQKGERVEVIVNQLG